MASPVQPGQQVGDQPTADQPDKDQQASSDRARPQPPGRRRPAGTRRGHAGHIVSSTPGRVRVRLRRGDRDDAMLAQIQQALRTREGIADVTTKTRTGSILVQYDPRRLSGGDLTSILHDVGVIASEIAGNDDVLAEALPGPDPREVVDHSSAAVSLMDALTDLDRRVSELTGGKVDIKLLFPLGLAAVALRQIATSGLGLAEVPAYVLLWYAFDTFYKLHQRRSSPRVLEAMVRRTLSRYVARQQAAPDVTIHDVTIVDKRGR